jgi:branched-chain amino acid transport system permease protein
MRRPCGVFDKTYQKDMAIFRTWQHWVGLIAALIVLYLLPLFAGYYYINLINTLSITIIAVLGLQIVSGYCGQISFGQPAFMAVGAYAAGILTLHYGLSFWLAMPIAGIIAGLIGLIGGAPSLRIKGFYMAMATMAIHFVVMWLILRLDITGKDEGLNILPPEIGNFSLDTPERMYFLIVTMMLVMTFAARNLVRSNIGRAFVAVRDNDLAAEVMGVNLFYYKLLAFFISCFYAGVAGSLHGHLLMIVDPEMFSIFDAMWMMGMIIVGGMGSIPGVFFGVIFLRLLDELVMFGSPMLGGIFPWLGIAPAASIGTMVFGIILVIFLIFEPRGLAHRWEIFKASYRIYPFAY